MIVSCFLKRIEELIGFTDPTFRWNMSTESGFSYVVGATAKGGLTGGLKGVICPVETLANQATSLLLHALDKGLFTLSYTYA